MNNEGAWKPTKFAYRDGQLSTGPATSDGSWLATQLVAKAYERHLPGHARGRLLDLGCGTVPLYAAYRPLVSEITCVDWSDSSGKALHLDLAHDLNQPLPLESARFDTVILSDVLEHIRKPELLLAETARVMAPAGKLLLNVPFLYWLHEQPHDYFRYSEHVLRSFIEQAGLRLLLLEGLGGGPEVLVDILGKHLVPLPAVGRLAARALQRAAFSLGRATRQRRALGPSYQRFPLGYFLLAERSSG